MSAGEGSTRRDRASGLSRAGRKKAARKTAAKKKPATKRKVVARKKATASRVAKKVTTRKATARKKATAKKKAAARPAPRKKVAKKAAAKRGARKVAARKKVTRKPVAKKAAVRKAATKKRVAKKSAARKAIARKPIAKKATAKKATAKKAAARKAGARKPAANEAGASKAVARKKATTAPAKAPARARAAAPAATRKPVRTIVSRAAEARWEVGLRPYFAYRDLGIATATRGKVLTQVIRTEQPCTGPTGYHSHDLDFQMVYLLRGWSRNFFEDVGEVLFEAGDAWYQPPRIRHEVVAYSDDFEALEITSPAEFPTTPESRDVQAYFVGGPRTVVSRGGEAGWATGLRPYFEYRDLGIRGATADAVLAHTMRAVKPCAGPGGYHSHTLDFQMVYLLRGAIRMYFEDLGEVHLDTPGDAWYQPPGIEHEVMWYSPDYEVLEITMPADFPTVPARR